MKDGELLSTLLPVIVLLALGVVTAIASRLARISPIVGYILLGLGLRASGGADNFPPSAIALFAELGVVFLLFDIGLHFSLRAIREQASDIFAFGPLQVVFAAVALGGAAWCFGLRPSAAALVGLTLALSSTAVVGRLIAERHQQNCPVGLTATAILLFQDVAAILLLIVADTMSNGERVTVAIGTAFLKAAAAFAVTVLVARFLIKPALNLIAQSKNEEIFTATALLIALAAGWSAGEIGLSSTLGAFLGGIALSETPFRAVITTEIKPFRGLLLGFFFVSVGLSLDVATIGQSWPTILALTAGLIVIKLVTNVLASLVFKWSVPGSTQLGFLLAQGSEFAFVILSLPPVRDAIGGPAASILVTTVALSMAVTPNLAEAGRSLAGNLRRRATLSSAHELVPRAAAAPVLIVGMGRVGRCVADALIEFGMKYHAIERDHRRLQQAIADGYEASFGDANDVRLWPSVDLHDRKLSVLTAPVAEMLARTAEVARTHFPDLKRFAIVNDEQAAQALIETRTNSAD